MAFKAQRVGKPKEIGSRAKPKTEYSKSRFAVVYTARKRNSGTRFMKQDVFEMPALNQLDVQTMLSKLLHKKDMELGAILEYGDEE